jgi:hypothetical protein
VDARYRFRHNSDEFPSILTEITKKLLLGGASSGSENFLDLFWCDTFQRIFGRAASPFAAKDWYVSTLHYGDLVRKLGHAWLRFLLGAHYAGHANILVVHQATHKI